MKNKGLILMMTAIFTIAVSCKKEGCMDPKAENYQKKAKKDDGSCTYADDVIAQEIVDNITTPTVIEDKTIKICGDIKISSSLTLQAGATVIMCAGASIEVTETGYINAIGTATNPIAIKGETQTKGFWEGIAIKSNNPNNQFAYVTISDAGTYWGWEYANVYVGANAKLSITNSTISNSDNVGLFVEDNATLSSFANNTFSNSTTGLNITVKHIGQIDGGSNYNLTNTNDYIFVRTGTLTTDATWPKTTTPILLNATTIESGLTITAGSNIIVESSGFIDVKSTGYISSIGTASAPITIKGRYASAGYWEGIVIRSNNPNNTFVYTTVSDGGAYWGWEYSNIYITGGRLNLDNSTVSNANSYGVYVKNTSSIYTSGVAQTTATGVEANNTITGNGTGANANCTNGCTVFFQ